MRLALVLVCALEALAFADEPAPHCGVTFDVEIGFGKVASSSDNNAGATGWGFAGPSAGVGAWVLPQLAVTGRIAGVNVPDNGVFSSDLFLGPTAQYWLDERFWASGGAGLGIHYLSPMSGDSDSVKGIAFDLRVGYVLSKSAESAISASLEVQPAHYSDAGQSVWLTGVGILVGYQYL